MLRTILLAAFISSACFIIKLNAQSISVSSINPDSLTSILQNYLQDDCIEILNASYTGSWESIGLFTSPANSIFPLDKGILLSTGSAAFAVGPNTTLSGSLSFNAPGDSLLSLLANDITKDAAVLNFDVVVYGDSSISLEYLYASEEYPEFVSSGFSDVMGIFITGQNLPYQLPYNNWNIGVVPGTNQTVCINTINQNIHSEYYIQNGYGGDEPVQFDGYTTVLSATAEIVPCSTYHIKIAIADVNDIAYDSGIFIKFKSLSTGEKDSYKMYDLSVLNSQIVNGCPLELRATKVDLSLLNDVVSVEPIFNYPGLINNYTQGLDSFLIPSGAMVLDFEVSTLPIETQNYHIYKVSHPTCFCYNPYEQFGVLPTNLLSTSILPADTFICQPESLQFSAITAFTYPLLLNYSWSDGSTNSYNSLYPSMYQNTLAVTVSDGCSQTVTDSITIYTFDLLEGLVPDSVPLINQTATLTACDVLGASYSWSTGSHSEQIMVSEIGTYTLTVSTDCGDISDEVVVYQPIGINEHTESAMHINPNPASEYFMVALPGAGEEVYWELLTPEGKKVLTGKSVDESFRVDIQELPYGIYLFAIQGVNYHRTSKLIIHVEN